jgi:hypothetical protein
MTAAHLCETWAWQSTPPKADDTVFMDGEGFVRYLVVTVDSTKHAADVRTVSGVIGLTRGMPRLKTKDSQ